MRRGVIAVVVARLATKHDRTESMPVDRTCGGVASFRDSGS